MALANFFAKAALAATQVARGLDVRALEDRLNRSLVAVAFDDVAASTREGRATLGLAVNLLARLYPRLTLVADGTTARELTPELRAQAAAINPNLEIGFDLSACAVCLAVGETAVRADAPTVYVGSNGWVTALSPDTPVGCRDTANPFGAGGAACFGVANVFRLLFAEYLPNGAPDSAFALSLLDYERDRPATRNLTLETIDLGETFLVGIGAIGSSAVWALSRVEGLGGILHLVDHEQVDLSNLQRYVLTQVPLEPLLRFEGQPLQIFYAEGVCGGVVLQLQGRDHEGVPQIAVPMAFQSALAGILLAAEVVAHAGGLRSSPLPVTTTLDLLRPLGAYLSFPQLKHPSGRCICQDRDYQAAYQRKYLSRPATCSSPKTSPCPLA